MRGHGNAPVSVFPGRAQRVEGHMIAMTIGTLFVWWAVSCWAVVPTLSDRGKLIVVSLVAVGSNLIEGPISPDTPLLPALALGVGAGVSVFTLGTALIEAVDGWVRARQQEVER